MRPRGDWPAVALVALLLSGCDIARPLGSQQGYMPAQPIAYSHALHAGLYEMDCRYCHFGAETSRHAGVPPVSVCMNCHREVRKDSPEIRKLTAYAAEDRPLAWEKVHRLPDFAYFNHGSHVGAGLACQRCHGPVEQMVRVTQVETMSMGFCLDCHRETRGTRPNAPLPLATLSDDALAAPESVPSRQLNPPLDCAACHR